VTIEEALHAKLTAVFDGTAFEGRVYPDEAPQTEGGAEPEGYVLYQRQGDDHRVYLSGGRDPTRIDTYAVEVWHHDRAELEPARNLLLDAFAGANCQGRWGGASGVWVQGAVASDAQADADPDVQGGERPDRGERLEVRIVWDNR
jgi:hypothetical protein